MFSTRTFFLAGLLCALFCGAAGAQGPLYSFYGDSMGDGFGYAVGGAGDVNKDATVDVVVGAAWDSNGGPVSGCVRVFSGANGALLHTFYGAMASAQLGFAVSGAGDVNKDGYADIIAGAPYDSPSGVQCGSARVFSGATGALLYTFAGDTYGDQMGVSVSGAGDVNKDGYADVIVGAPMDEKNGTRSGSAFVFSGATGAQLFLFKGDSPDEWLGTSVSGAGDVNADGYDDVIVGAPYDDYNGVHYSGSAKVFSGKTGAILYFFGGSLAHDNFGKSVSGAGDVNADGYDDFVTGTPTLDVAGSNAGNVQVRSGKTGGVLYSFNGGAAGDLLGASVAGAGDVNGDGYDDIVAGMTGDDDLGADCGGVRVYSGKDGAVLATFHGDAAGDRLGQSVDGTGDVDHDGFGEVIGGAPQNDQAGAEAGKATVFRVTPCSGSATAYGAACAGSGGFVPSLAVSGCVTQGGILTVQVAGGLGGAFSMMFVGLSAASLPAGGGCTLLLNPIVLSIPLPLGGSGPGNGAITVPATIPYSAPDVIVKVQVFVADAGAGAQGFSTTNGVSIDIH